MTVAFRPWPTQTTCLKPSSIHVATLADEIYERVCRTDFTQPGFCVVNLGTETPSQDLRQLMVDVKNAMAAIHQQRTGQTLIYLSAGRFDQQTSTRPHLDGGPDESLLMLGYEPSEVSAELEISDYSHCAADMGLTPSEFMEQHNPMFHAGYELLRPYAHPLRCFDPAASQIVVINNSSARLNGKSWQGTLHTATILNPDDSKRRVINSTMIAPAPAGTPDVVGAADLRDFIATSLVRRKGYDETHLADDR